jgi:lactoylglutathione lyase
MHLAKQHLDIGLFTTNEAAMLAFWQQEAGLVFEEALPLGGGVRQHRHAMNGSVFKLNAARDPLNEAPPSGYRELFIARDGLEAPRRLVDPDGNALTLVPRGHLGIDAIAVRVVVADAAAQAKFYGHAMQFEELAQDRFQCGDTILLLEEDASCERIEALRAPGFRYLTVQIRDVNEEHAGILSRGGVEGRPPVTLGTTARVSFVRDPGGNWIEVSQRASLTGALSGD